MARQATTVERTCTECGAEYDDPIAAAYCCLESE